MPGPSTLRRAALLVALCLQLACHVPEAAPLSPREEARPGEASPKTQDVLPGEIRVRSLPETGPEAATHKAARDDLFQDVDPKALAAVLLQALHLQPEKPSVNEESVRSETKSSEAQPGSEQGWKGWEEGDQSLEAEAPGQQEVEETLTSMLQELQRHSPLAKREASAAPEHMRNDVLKELEEYEQLRVHTKRKAPTSEPWEGAKKLRQQQHLEHQLLQRRYEELAESRRQAEEARRAAAEEERLADMASDLLLQYLLKDGEESQEEGRAGAEEEAGRKGGSALLFEDEEEDNVAEDKRSNEVPEEEEDPEDDEEDIDPNTIDRLIELSSKLHLPADDVIDIINDVEKKRKKEGEEGAPPEALGKGSKAPAGDKPKKTPAFPPGPKPLQKPYYPPAARQPPRRLPKEDEDAWNEVLRGEEYQAPKWFRAQQDSLLSNYINPRTFQPPPAYPRYAPLPGPMVPRGKYYGDSRAHDQELENYLERVLMARPKGF